MVWGSMNRCVVVAPPLPSINNVLIIGMTNRKDMIDDAVLRPGRLEVGRPIVAAF